MKSGQFVVGMLDGEIESYESKNITQLLPPEEMDKLWRLTETHGVGAYNYFNPDERVVARSTITKTENDKVGRSGLINHTVIFKHDKYIIHEGTTYRFDESKFKLEDHLHLLDTPFPAVLENPLPLPEVKP